MKATLGKRLSWIELVMSRQDEREAVVIDFSVFSDADLDRLEWFAGQRDAWSGSDWFDAGLSSVERQELDGLLKKVAHDPE